MRFLFWLGERALEVLFVAALLMLLSRPFDEDSEGIASEVLKTLTFPLFFYLLSGYIVSCLFLGLLFRARSTFRRASLMTVLYSLHVAGLATFLGIWTDADAWFLLAYMALGLPAVFLAHVIGGRIETVLTSAPAMQKS